MEDLNTIGNFLLLPEIQLTFKLKINNYEKNNKVHNTTIITNNFTFNYRYIRQ